MTLLLLLAERTITRRVPPRARAKIRSRIGSVSNGGAFPFSPSGMIRTHLLLFYKREKRWILYRRDEEEMCHG